MKVILVLLGLMLLAGDLEAQGAPAGLTAEDWNACLSYQSKYAAERDLAKRLAVALEAEKVERSKCVGAFELLQNSQPPALPVDQRTPQWLVASLAGASGVLLASGAFLLFDGKEAAGAAMAAGGAAGVVFSFIW